MRFNKLELGFCLLSLNLLLAFGPATAWSEDSPTPTAPVDLDSDSAPVVPSPPALTDSKASSDLDSVALPPEAPSEASKEAVTPPSAKEPPTILTGSSDPDSNGRTSSEAVDTPHYTYSQPTYAVSLMGTLAAASVPYAPSAGSVATQKLRGLGVGLEFQPEFLQSFGVLGIGPNFTYFFTSEVPDQITAGGFAIYSLGGEIRYQARFFHEQILVPFIGYEMESMAYRLKNTSGTISLSGLAFGGMLLLNALEPEAAGTFYSDQGVSRSYLVAEWRGRSGTDKNLTFSGSAFFFGLRIEF